jgi:hypothetical protein
MKDTAQRWLRTALWCALFIFASHPSGALVQSRRSDAGIDNSRLAFLSEPRDKATLPAEETPRATPQEDNKNFDGAWTFRSAGCSYTGSYSSQA